MNSSITPPKSSRLNSLSLRCKLVSPTADPQCTLDPDRFQEHLHGRRFLSPQGTVNFSYHCLDAQARFDDDHNLSVYGNPLWTEDRSPVRSKDAAAAADNPHEGPTGPLLLLDGPLPASSPQHNRLSYSLDSSDGDDQDALYGNAKFWNSCRFKDVRSRSTSKSSSVYDLDSSTESKEFSDDTTMQEKRNATEIKADYSRKSKKSERNPESEKEEIDIWSMKSPGSVCKRNDSFKGNQEEDVNLSEHAIGRECGQPVGNYERFHPTDPQLYDLTVDGDNQLSKCRNSILWSFEGFKKDSRTLSPQDEDYLYKNSDLLASFEVQEHLNPNDENFSRHGRTELYEDQYESSLRIKYAPFAPTKCIDYPCQTNCVEEPGNKKTMSEFDDTSSWITNNSEGIDSEQLQYDAIARNFESLSMNGEASKKESTIDEMDDLSLQTKEMSTSVSCASDASTKNSSVPFHEVDVDESESQKQAFNVVESKTEELDLLTVVNGLEKEVYRLKTENRRLEKLLKENEHKMAEIQKERILWEQKKLSEMNTFNTFKEKEVQRLKKERSRLEQQAKCLAQLPTKKERNEIEELRKKIATIVSDHEKKESLQNLTINRLRRTIADLTEQIRSLEEEVKRYELFLQSEWGTDNMKMINLQQVTSTEKFQKTQHENDAEIAKKLQHGGNLNRVSTPMYWTRPQQ